jgi:hypothetical protein
MGSDYAFGTDQRILNRLEIKLVVARPLIGSRIEALDSSMH